MVSVLTASVYQDGETITGEPSGPEETNAETQARCRDDYPKDDRSRSIVWRNVILMVLLHTGAVYSLIVIPQAQHLTWIWCKSARQRTCLV